MVNAVGFLVIGAWVAFLSLAAAAHFAGEMTNCNSLTVCLNCESPLSGESMGDVYRYFKNSLCGISVGGLLMVIGFVVLISSGGTI